MLPVSPCHETGPTLVWIQCSFGLAFQDHWVGIGILQVQFKSFCLFH